VKRVVQALVAVGCAALALLLLFTGRTAKDAERRIELASRPGAVSAFREEATLRNVTKAPIAYTIGPGPGRTAPLTRTLAVRAVERIATDLPVEITFDNGRRTADYLIHPGRPYSFRYDESGVIRVYPGAHGRTDAADLAPYVPTPRAVVSRMIEVAAIGPDDVVYDLGCGDGRMVIAAAKLKGARGVGVELDDALLEECRAAAGREGVPGRVRFVKADATKARLTEATVLLLYLLPESLETLAPVFERDLRPGARIVSHDYRIPGWDGRIVLTEVLPGESGRDHRVILYRMPETR
jgi:SAM-dependent methyltransferase